MSYPTNLETVTGLPGTWLVDILPSTYTLNQKFEVFSTVGWYQPDANGVISTVPLGASGPFVLKVDSEYILCSAVNYSTNTITVWESGNLNGRGYNSSTAAPHGPGGSAIQHVSVYSASVQGGLPSAGSTVTLTSSVASQNTNSTWATYYIGITGGASGTVKVDIGPTSATTTNIIPAAANNATSGQTLHIRIPAGWYLKVTTSVATINASSVIVVDSL